MVPPPTLESAPNPIKRVACRPPSFPGLLGSTNLFAHCRGSPLLLLFVALVKNGGLWVGFYSIFTRLDPAWNRAALPLLALPPVRRRAALPVRLPPSLLRHDGKSRHWGHCRQWHCPDSAGPCCAAKLTPVDSC